MCPVDFAPSPLKPQAYGTDFLCRQASSQTKETLMPKAQAYGTDFLCRQASSQTKETLMPEAKAYVTFRMLHTTHRRLKQLTDLTGRPMTDLLDEAVANALREAQERRTCGCIRSAR
jgi:hypothetical protein